MKINLIVIMLILLVVVLVAAPVAAQSYHHEIVIQLEGEYKILADVELPDSKTNIDLEGVGKAFISSKLVVVNEDVDSLKAWWELF